VHSDRIQTIVSPAEEDVIMYRTRRMTAVLALGIGLAVSSAGLAAATAPAAQVRPAGTGLFRTWPAAQSAAGFRLARPARTYGLHRSGLIAVSRCETKGKLGKRDVEAVYGDTPNASLIVSQNNSGGRCGVFGRSTRLGRYKVHGVWASLTGECNLPSLPSCTSRKIFLFLTWQRHGVYYRASAHDESRRTIVGFARALVPVR
jgi:hypothetical protein